MSRTRALPSWSTAGLGILVGACFCVMVVVNQMFVGARMLTAGADVPRELLQSVIRWFALVSVLAHVFLWTAYAALVTAAGRVCFDGSRHPVVFRDVFSSVGWAHVPLLCWACGGALVWLAWGRHLTAPDIAPLVAVYAAARLAGYLLGIVLLTRWLQALHQTTVWAAAVATGAPAAGLWLALALVNGVTGALVRSGIT